MPRLNPFPSTRPYAQPSGEQPPVRQRRAARPRKSPSFPITLLLGAGLLGLLSLLIALPVGFYAYFQVSGRILPGVRVGEVSLGGMSVYDAAVAVNTNLNLEKRIILADGIHTFEVAPSDLGLGVDPLETAQRAYAVGHGQSLLAEWGQMVYSLQDGWEVQPAISFDEDKARASLEALTPEMSKAPREASLSLQGGTLTPTPGELGYTINLEDTMANLVASPEAVLFSGRLQVALKPVAPRVMDVSAIQAQAEQFLNTPVNIQAYDAISDEHFDWPLPRETLGSWLIVEPGDQGPQIGLDANKVAEYLNQLSEGLGPERWLDSGKYSGPLIQAIREGAPLTLIVSHKPTTYVVRPGDTLTRIGWNVGIPYWLILKANPDLNPDSLWAGQEIVIPSKDELLPLPVIPNKRIVISISQQRLWVYQDGNLLSKHVISTGIDRSPTQPGIFQVQTHELNAYASVWDLYMPHFLGIYESWPGFMNGIHGLPTLSNGRRLWASILGKPASYGCIILDLNAAENLYNWAENGVVVEIRP